MRPFVRSRRTGLLCLAAQPCDIAYSLTQPPQPAYYSFPRRVRLSACGEWGANLPPAVWLSRFRRTLAAACFYLRFVRAGSHAGRTGFSQPNAPCGTHSLRAQCPKPGSGSPPHRRLLWSKNPKQHFLSTMRQSQPIAKLRGYRVDYLLGSLDSKKRVFPCCFRVSPPFIGLRSGTS